MMKLKQHICILLVCLMSALGMMAQVKISGKVVDDAGHPIEFATVRILGTTIGVNTNEKGFYEMSVPKNDTIKSEST